LAAARRTSAAISAGTPRSIFNLRHILHRAPCSILNLWHGTNISHIEHKLQPLLAVQAFSKAIKLRSKGSFTDGQQVGIELADAEGQQLSTWYLWQRQRQDGQGTIHRMLPRGHFPNVKQLLCRETMHCRLDRWSSEGRLTRLRCFEVELPAFVL